MLSEGDFVQHAILGIGKVVSHGGDTVRVYFPDQQKDPDSRVSRFPVGSSHLSPIDPFPHPELDNLPPWKDGKFARTRTELSVDRAKELFKRQFAGFDDREFVRRERSYKLSAHERFKRLSADREASTLTGAEVAQLLNDVYGENRKDGTQERLNLLYQKVDEPAYFEALYAGGPRTVDYYQSALEFIRKSDENSFRRYAKAIDNLPTRAGGAKLDGWTTITWLPFIADPSSQFLIKPTIVQAFASILPFEINYNAHANFLTYRRCVEMALRMRDVLEKSELNPSQRTIDLIDVQSFMWVVMRYTDNDLRTSA